MADNTPRVRNGLCLEVNPEGCAEMVRADIARERAKAPVKNGPRSVLVLGCSGGYGLASRITAAYGSGAETLGVSFERVPDGRKTGSPGFYNNAAFDEQAKADGLKAATLNADAFTAETRELVAKTARGEGFKPFDLIVYSLASPVRTDPVTGVQYRSAIKPIGEACVSETLDFMTGEMKEVVVPPASDEEILATIKVMGGEDWNLWIRFLMEEGLLAEGVKTVAYSYIGPACTQKIYRSGTLGRAKEHLEETARLLTGFLQPIKGSAVVSVNKALVTRASAVIPAMPPYIAALFKVMKEKGTHEDCQDQADRLFRDRLYTADGIIPTDDAGRIRIDDWEMRPEIQEAVSAIMSGMNPTNVEATTDLAGYRHDFLALHGFTNC